MDIIVLRFCVTSSPTFPSPRVEPLTNSPSTYSKETEVKILLDGGKGQVNAVLPVFEKYGLDIPIFGMVKDSHHKTRAIALSGSFMPQRFKSLVDKFGSNPEAMKQAGIAYATDQIIDLYANGITNVHVYSMNNPDVARKIQENLSDILG